jgi:hypothetical protein
MDVRPGWHGIPGTTLTRRAYFAHLIHELFVAGADAFREAALVEPS